MTADDTCLSSLIDQPLEVRVVDQHDDEPSHPCCPRWPSFPRLSLHGAAAVPVDMHNLRYAHMHTFETGRCLSWGGHVDLRDGSGVYLSDGSATCHTSGPFLSTLPWVKVAPDNPSRLAARLNMT